MFVSTCYAQERSNADQCTLIGGNWIGHKDNSQAPIPITAAVYHSDANGPETVVDANIRLLGTQIMSVSGYGGCQDGKIRVVGGLLLDQFIIDGTITGTIIHLTVTTPVVPGSPVEGNYTLFKSWLF